MSDLGDAVRDTAVVARIGGTDADNVDAENALARVVEAAEKKHPFRDSGHCEICNALTALRDAMGVEGRDDE